MNKLIVPKKYAPFPPNEPGNTRKPLAVELTGFFYNYYFNIELDETMNFVTKKRYLASLMRDAQAVFKRHYNVEVSDLEPERRLAYYDVMDELRERHELFSELASKTRPTLLKVPRTS